MHPSQIHIHLYQPDAPRAETLSGGFGHQFTPFAPPLGAEPSTPANSGEWSLEPAGARGSRQEAPAPPAAPPVAQAFIAAGRRPLRDWVRDRVVAAVLAAAPPGTTQAAVADAVDDVAGDRPLLDWLANGGLEALIRLVLTLLKLAA